MIILRIDQETEHSFEHMTTCREYLESCDERVDMEFVASSYILAINGRRARWLLFSMFISGVLFGAAFAVFFVTSV